uniref:Headcase middle domain-containing protein n=1 Tax=Anopheles culicifacies TaxID=139723 RepID=A0A182LY31_9DIPT
MLVFAPDKNLIACKIEDEGNHGNDETRLFILSSLAAQHKSRVACVLCEEPMLVFDRYPLVDGTFFLSPKQHNKGCIEVKYENRIQYLTSVCMACLEGVEPNRVVRCRFCVNKWDGSSLVLGTMYSYDIFAAMPCCTERLKATLESPKSSVNSGSLMDATGRQEQQSPFNGSSASCTVSTSTLADKAAADSAAMNSFIQELRHLSNSSTISNISSASNDSGFSTSYCGDSNVGSGRAAATLSNSMQLQQQQHQLNNKPIATGTLSKNESTINPALSSIVWGNKSLWGPAPPSPSAAAVATAPSLVSPSAASLKPTMDLSSAVTTNPTSNALYTNLSKELYTPWTTSTANMTPPSMVSSQTQQLPCTISQHNDSTNLPKTLPICSGNTGTNIWESKLGLVSGPPQSLEPLESIWSAPEPASAGMNGVIDHGTTASCQNVWQSDVPSGAREAYMVGSQFLRIQESMNGRLSTTGNAIDTIPKLSSLWTQTPWASGVNSTAINGSNISVLRSLRMGESASTSSSCNVITKDADVVCNGTVEKNATTASSFMTTMVSDDYVKRHLPPLHINYMKGLYLSGHFQCVGEA